MKKVSKIAGYSALGILSVPAAFFLYMAAVSRGKAKPFRDRHGNEIPGSISEIARVKINGSEQGLIIRGRDITKPVLLYIHGGPGIPEFPFARQLNPGLEGIFVVCYWEQRGAGMSYSNSIPGESMNLKTFEDDALKITEYLKKRFDREKIYILGHSWGSYLGALLARDYPYHFKALITTGQVTDQTRSELLTYKEIIDIAKQDGKKSALKALSKIGPPPYFLSDNGFRRVSIMRLYITRLSSTTKRKWLLLKIAKGLITCSEYTMRDKLNFIRGTVFTLKTMLDYIMAADLFKEVPSLRIPVYILQGTSDLQTAYPLALQYYENLNAPVRRFYSFTESAHSPSFEEPEKFNSILGEIVSENEK